MTTIRPITEDDAAAFWKILDAVCRERRYLAAFEAPSIERVREFVTSNVRAGYPQFVAEEGKELVGWCDAIPGDHCAGTAHVGTLGMGVLEGFRNKKIGRRLLAATIERSKTIGLEKIELSVYSFNEPAIALYRNFGFEEEGRKKRGRLVDGIYEDVILMALTLKADKTPPPTARSDTR